MEPRFFLYRWEPRQGGKNYELVIDIPRNIKQILEKSFVDASDKELEGILKSDLLWKRKSFIE